MIAWHDNIPVVSWLLLKAQCRNCKQPISFLYPLIELLTAGTLTTVYFYTPTYFVSYFFFVSALMVTIRSDIETMLISRYVTLALVPIGLLLSTLGWLPISLTESSIGFLFGYSILWFIATTFEKITGKHGLGQGDLDLLAFIGAFTGVVGCWITMLIGSITGSLVGIGYIILYQKRNTTRIPFGPFLAFGAISYILLQDTILKHLLNL